MFNVPSIHPPHCYWNDIMSCHCPTGEVGGGGTCAMHGCWLCVLGFFFELPNGTNLASYMEGIWPRIAQITLKIIHNPLHPVYLNPQWFLVPLLTPVSYPFSLPYLPFCWFICALSLSSHLSGLSISSCSCCRCSQSGGDRYCHTAGSRRKVNHTPTGLCQQVTLRSRSTANMVACRVRWSRECWRTPESC